MENSVELIIVMINYRFLFYYLLYNLVIYILYFLLFIYKNPHLF